MAFGLRFFCFLLFASLITCSARNTILLSGDEVVVVAMEGRSLKVSTDDYSEPSANRGHDPKNKVGAGSSGGRKSLDTP